MVEKSDTVIIGGGQAGLSLSYHLSQRSRPHVVLERGRIGERWRSERWDSLTLLTPNWLTRLPGYEYDGADPDGFMTKEEVVQTLERYGARIKAPLRSGCEVVAVRPTTDHGRWLVRLSDSEIEASNVVVATGPFQKPRAVIDESRISKSVRQLHTDDYRNPAQLPPGAVLVVGSGSSGCQICEELYLSGRKVFLSTGRCQRRLRRYRGKDHCWWLYTLGSYEERAEGPQPYGCRAQITGVGGGHDLDYDRFANAGVTLLGRLESAEGDTVRFEDNLQKTIADWDDSLAPFRRTVDAYIEKTGMDAPPHEETSLSKEWRKTPPPTEISLSGLGITSIVWTAGYTYDFGWIDAPVFNEREQPVHRRGVTSQPGLYFLGLAWLSKLKSSFIFGADEDAAYIAEHIADRAK